MDEINEMLRQLDEAEAKKDLLLVLQVSNSLLEQINKVILDFGTHRMHPSEEVVSALDSAYVRARNTRAATYLALES